MKKYLKLKDDKYNSILLLKIFTKTTMFSQRKV